MADTEALPLQSSFRSRPRRRPLVPAPIFAVLLFLFVDLMFFAAFLSSYFVIRRGRSDWIPESIRLPVESVGFNTLVLILSGLFLVLATRSLTRGKNLSEIRAWLFRSLFLGSLFLVFQLWSAFQLFRSGLTIESSVFGGYYFLMIGTHAVNALAGIAAIGWLIRRLSGADRNALVALQYFWLFVVGSWVALYAEIYLYS